MMEYWGWSHRVQTTAVFVQVNPSEEVWQSYEATYGHSKYDINNKPYIELAYNSNSEDNLTIYYWDFGNRCIYNHSAERTEKECEPKTL